MWPVEQSEFETPDAGYYRDHVISTILSLIESYLALSYVLP